MPYGMINSTHCPSVGDEGNEMVNEVKLPEELIILIPTITSIVAPLVAVNKVLAWRFCGIHVVPFHSNVCPVVAPCWASLRGLDGNPSPVMVFSMAEVSVESVIATCVPQLSPTPVAHVGTPPDKVRTVPLGSVWQCIKITRCIINV